MKKVKATVLLTEMNIEGIHHKPRLEYIAFYIRSLLTAEEVEFLRSALIEKKELQITIKDANKGTKKQT